MRRRGYLKLSKRYKRNLDNYIGFGAGGEGYLTKDYYQPHLPLPEFLYLSVDTEKETKNAKI